MDDDKKKHLRKVSLLSLAGFCLIGGIWLHQENTISRNNQITHSEQVSAHNYHHDGQTYTIAKSEHDYDAKEPDLGMKLQNNRTQVKKGLVLAFSDSARLHNYYHNKKAIASDLGSDVSGKVLSLIKPQVGDDKAFDTPRSISQSLTNYIISYGEFDDKEESVPMTIYATYRTPPYRNVDDPPKLRHTRPHTGHVMISAVYSTKDGSMELNNEYDSID